MGEGRCSGGTDTQVATLEAGVGAGGEKRGGATAEADGSDGDIGGRRRRGRLHQHETGGQEDV